MYFTFWQKRNKLPKNSKKIKNIVDFNKTIIFAVRTNLFKKFHLTLLIHIIPFKMLIIIIEY